MFPKQKRVKLHGKAKRDLRAAIFERDQYMCVVCGSADWTQWHHHPGGLHKSDELEKGVVLCNRCHRRLHDGPNSLEIKRACDNYLNRLYGGNYEIYHT